VREKASLPKGITGSNPVPSASEFYEFHSLLHEGNL